jgi:poly(3-hydroxybutyrate) depolymerase
MLDRSLLRVLVLSAAAVAGCSVADSGMPENSGQAGNGSGYADSAGSTASAGSDNGVSGSPGTAGLNAAGTTNTSGSVNGGAGTGGTAAGSGGVNVAGSNSGGSGGASMGGSAGTGGAASAVKSAGCGKMPTIPSGMYNNGQHIAITAANMQREYILSVPGNYDNTKPYKLIIAYHQLDGDDNQMYNNKYYHLQPLSNDTTIFVAPNGQKNGANCTSAPSCGWPNTKDSDLALADAVVAQVKENFCIDTNRIFATGWSYGGSMSYKTACERPLGTANGFIRGIAVYSGAQLSGMCNPSKSVAYYGSHGTSDNVLGYDGGVTLSHNFATANSCSWMTPTKVTTGNHACTNLMGCGSGYPVEFCSFNGPHTPDPKDPNMQTSWQYQLVWDFFKQF